MTGCKNIKGAEFMEIIHFSRNYNFLENVILDDTNASLPDNDYLVKRKISEKLFTHFLKSISILKCDKISKTNLANYIEKI